VRRFRIGMAAAVAGVAVLATSGTSAAYHAGSGVAAKKPTKLQQITRSLVKASGAPGAIAFIRSPNGARSAAAGVASFQPRVAMRAVDHFRIASLTKTFVATVVLQLVGEGKLGLGDTVERRLPGVVPNGSAITIRELLNHTSGLFNYTEDEAWSTAALANPQRPWTPKELLSFAFSHPANFAPGTNWSYSNTNYVVLGLIVEATTGKAIADELRTRIFEPLNLRQTSFPSELALPEPAAHGYVRPEGGTLIDLNGLFSPTWAYAAGQIVSTAADVTTFFAMLLKGRLLPSALLKEMKTPVPVAGTYGLGLITTITRCGRAWGHNGDFFGWRNLVLSTANGRRTADVMVNIDPSRVSWPRLESAALSALCSG
jgi:D-alanyl-D-alanine carboxypeptidase